MREKLSTIFDLLETLEIKPTMHNLRVLYTVLSGLQEVYQELAAAAEEDGNEQTDAE